MQIEKGSRLLRRFNPVDPAVIDQLDTILRSPYLIWLSLTLAAHLPRPYLLLRLCKSLNVGSPSGTKKVWRGKASVFLFCRSISSLYASIHLSYHPYPGFLNLAFRFFFPFHCFFQVSIPSPAVILSPFSLLFSCRLGSPSQLLVPR